MNTTADETTDAADTADPAAPSVTYWHLWTDKAGVTHQKQCGLKNLAMRQFAPPSPAMWVESLGVSPSAITFLVLPPGFDGGWHRNPKPQWIIPMSGRWFVEAMDGTRVEMGPGELSFGEDQAAKRDTEGREGHRSGTIGAEPAVLMLVQVSDPPKVGEPCRFE